MWLVIWKWAVVIAATIMAVHGVVRAVDAARDGNLVKTTSRTGNNGENDQ